MQIIINGKQMDAGRFLYDFENEKEFYKNLKIKLEEFFAWYSGFQNIESITKVEICTSDVSCDYNCAVPLVHLFSTIDTIIGKEKLISILNPLGKKYNLNIKLLY